jgi:membrane protein required for colicin V production
VTWLDYAVLGVMALSTAWGLWRGLVREVISLAGWVLAFIAANLFAEPLAQALPQSISNPDLRVIVAFAAIFVVTLTLVTLAAVLLSKALKSTGLAGLDRTLGGLFGVARGLLIVLAFTLVAGLTSFPQHPMWKASWSGPMLGRTVDQLKSWLPPALADRLRYH